MVAGDTTGGMEERHVDPAGSPCSSPPHPLQPPSSPPPHSPHSPSHPHPPPKKTDDLVKLKALCRRVAPYIVHRWKDVCDELDVLTKDIVYVQARHLSGATLSDLAFQGLCCWLEKGHNQSKQQLLKALQVCGLKRAEEEVDQAVRIPLPSGFLPEKKDKSRQVKRISRQQAFINRMAIPKPKSSRPKYLLHGRKKPKVKKKISGEICEMRVIASVMKVIPGEKTPPAPKMPTNPTVSSDLFDRIDYRNSCQSFCRRALANLRHKTELIQGLLNFPGFSIQRINRLGFAVHIYVLFNSLGGLEMFYQTWRSGRLKAVLTDALIRDTHLEQSGGTIELGLQVDEGLIIKFREVLVVRLREEAPKLHPTDNLPSLKKAEEPAKGVDKDFSVKAWRRELDWEIDRIESRYNSFKNHYSDMLMTLRIAHPASGTSEIVTLGDVIERYKYLRANSGSTVSKNIRVDLVREYIAIINKIRLVVENIRANEVKISMDQSISPSACEVFHLLLQRLEGMLKLSYTFKVDHRKTNAFSGFKGDSFTGVVGYIPSLISKLTAMNDRLAEV